MRLDRTASVAGRVPTQHCLLALAAMLGIAAPSARAFAAPEEIQVYEDDMDKPGQFGLDIHNNYVWGQASPVQYPQEQQPDYRYRVTPEFSYGLTPNVELGLYLPLGTIADRQFRMDGVKARIKYIAPRPANQDWYWGANFEIGAVRPSLDVNPWNAELKGIAGWRHGPWDLAVNANLDWVVSGPHSEAPSLQLATKASYKVSNNLALGVESYNGVGDFHALKTVLSPAGQGHSTFLTADTSLGKWDLNLGIGRGYSGEPDQWIFKFIVSVPIDD